MGTPAEYRPRNPAESLLYRTVAGHLETFLDRQEQRGRPVPGFVERELRSFLPLRRFSFRLVTIQTYVPMPVL